jgi:cytochrome c oxidase cbb3-type subunit III
MLSFSRHRWFRGLAAAFFATSISVSLSQAAKPRQKSKPASAGAKQLFASSCAPCHGLDGKGSERAPNIVDGENVRRMSHAQIFGIVQNGVPGTGMPAFHTFTAAQIDALIHHLRTLSGSGKPVQLPGDPVAGKTLFAGKAACSQCHMVLGGGGFVASNLSDYGRGHSAEQIRSAIVNPGNSGSSVRTATIELLNGEKYTGRVRNEDNFSIQLQDLNGAFHLLPRSSVATFNYDSKSMMPSDYGSTLTPKELDDLVSYLISAAEDSQKAGADKANDEGCSPSGADSDD